MKKIFTLLTLLLCAVTSSWATDAVTDLKNIHSNLTIYFDDYVTANVSANTLFADGYLFSPLGNNYNSSKGSDADDHLYCCRVKSKTQDEIAFKVDGACTLVLSGERVTDRTPRLNTDASDTEASRITGTVTAGASGQKWGTVSYTIPAAGTYYIIGSGSDNFLSALKFTFVPTAAPTIVKNLDATADAIVGMASEFTFEAKRTESYQWYKNSANEAVVDNEHKIAGATSSTYEYTATVAGDEYLYCVATNSIESTTSNVCKVTATATTLYTITYELNGGTSATGAPTQGNLAEGATFDVAAAPADLVAPTGKEFKCWNDGNADYNPGDTYTMGTSNVTLTAVYQDRTYHGLTPTGTLDLTDGTNFTSVWYTTTGKLTRNFFYDAPNGIAVMSSYAVYQSKNAGAIDWEVFDSGNSGGSAWSATGSFKGSSYYFASDVKGTSVQQSERNHYYRVTGITSVSALFAGKAGIAVYEVNAGVVAPDPSSTSEISEAGTATVTGLSASKEYIVKVYGKNGSSNIYFQEIAFNFPAVTSVTATINPTYEWATFSCNYALDFSTVTDLEAYIVTGHEGTTITKQQVTGTVPAGTGLLLNGATASIPVAASSSTNVSSNLLKAGNGSEISAVSGKTRYVLGVEGGKAQFQKIVSTPATVPVGKAYLQFDEEIASRSLGFDDEVTAIKNIKVGTEDNVYYDLNGRRVLYPKKGLYIVNGKKVIVK